MNARHSSQQRPTSILAKPATNKPAFGKLLGAQRIKKQVFYLGGIAPECSADDIITFYSTYCHLLECRMLPSRRTGTQAARIVVAETEAAKLTTIVWPEHLYLRQWEFDWGWGIPRRREVVETSELQWRSSVDSNNRECQVNHQTYPPKHVLSENRTISSKHSTNIRTITRPRWAKFFITQLNCQGLLGKFAFLKELIMEVWKSDIICLSETWLQPTCTTSSSLSIPNYFFFRRDRASRTHGGLII